MCKAEPTSALLADRLRWIDLCCGDLERCDRALATVAEYLAAEIRHDEATALNRATEFYLYDVGRRAISEERAAELRRMTVAACIRHRAPMELLGAWVADDAPPQCRAERNEFGLLAKFVAGTLAALVLIGWGCWR